MSSGAGLVVRRRAAVASEVIDDEAVLVDPHGGLHVLNTTATLIWDALDGTTSVAGLAARLCPPGVEPAIVERDVATVVERLVGQGLAELVQDPPGEPRSDGHSDAPLGPMPEREQTAKPPAARLGLSADPPSP